MVVDVLFFFSSRRRHTISKRDWSSDVCSSDLADLDRHGERRLRGHRLERLEVVLERAVERIGPLGLPEAYRSEERRVGKECRSRWARDHETKRREMSIEGTTCG